MRTSPLLSVKGKRGKGEGKGEFTLVKKESIHFNYVHRYSMYKREFCIFHNEKNYQNLIELLSLTSKG